MMRKKLPAMPEFRTFSGMEKAPAHRVPIYDYYAGKSDIVPHGTAGILFDDGSVAIQTYAADPYTLAHKFAGHWYELCPVRMDDPEMIALDQHGKVHRPGRSASQQAAQDKREAKRREEQERSEAYHAQRQQEAIKRREALDRDAERRRQEWIALHS